MRWRIDKIGVKVLDRRHDDHVIDVKDFDIRIFCLVCLPECAIIPSDSQYCREIVQKFSPRSTMCSVASTRSECEAARGCGTRPGRIARRLAAG